MARISKHTTNRNGTVRQIVGLGFLPVEARHGFLIEVPKGSGRNDFIRISEHRNVDLSRLSPVEQASSLLSPLTQSQAGSLSHVAQASCLLTPVNPVLTPSLQTQHGHIIATIS